MKTQKDCILCPTNKEHKEHLYRDIQHTLTPWRLVEVPSVDLWGKKSDQATILSPDRNHIAVIGGNSEANAKYIVRAVNSHEDMLLALEEVKSYLIKTGRRDARSYVDQIAEAIAKAEGK